MARSHKTWRDKLLDDKNLPKVSVIEGKRSKRWGEGTCAIPAPREVDEIMKAVPKGRLITTREIQAKIAQKHHATMACPICCGIFAWIAAHAADEAATEGAKRITPYWRTLKAGGELNPKFPGGAEALKVRLEAEGHRVVAKGKKWIVADYEDCLASGGSHGRAKSSGQASSKAKPAKSAGRGR
jgi:alkylated DNA nucleotide flippase Atl1